MSERPPYLTDAEVAEITSPLRQGAARIKYFRKLGCKVEPRPNGQPLVLRAEFEAAMLGKQANTHAAGQSGAHNIIRPDWSALPGFKRRQHA